MSAPLILTIAPCFFFLKPPMSYEFDAHIISVWKKTLLYLSYYNDNKATTLHHSTNLLLPIAVQWDLLLKCFIFLGPPGTCATLHVRRAHPQWFWAYGKPSTRTLGIWTLWPVPLRKSAKSSPPGEPPLLVAGKRSLNSQNLGREGLQQINSWWTITAWTLMIRCTD